MPAKDIYHEILKRALLKDGWNITHDPLRLKWGAKDMYFDLGAEQLVTAEKAGQKIAVEIKSFVGASDTLESYRQCIQTILREYARVPYSHGDVRIEPVFDRDSDRYLLVIIGRENDRRVHGCLVHIDIINGKVWIQRDGTERGIANEFVEAGIPKNQIVLGFRSPELRKHTEFAVA